MTGRGSASRFLGAVLHNGVGRHVRQLQRLQLVFSPVAPDARGARQFVEEAAVDFARRHPDVVLYVSPRRCPAPLLIAEYRECPRGQSRGHPALLPPAPLGAAVNGAVHEELVSSRSCEEIAGLAARLAARSGLDIVRIRKPFHTASPSVQGQWHPFTNKRPGLAARPNK
ncbi:39S ribosomal protein L43, mitochondrial isoform X2 [Nothoprocta perdicaria]|uniref:39S ribosomal protein L43, mitochondrial isoform X2 n=1 Tax=Nothoprocta perdicaria TaxID=30464 RepID=UPI000E1BF75B|nr:39S ribosomal protein L43, mitochondrial isoform X2 [Nothoprocta perdicaria]